MKKRIAIVLLLVLGLSALAGCTPKANDDGPKELVVSIWGYNEDKLRENVFAPFEEANNVKIVLETGNNSDRLTKLKNNPNSGVDVIYLAESFAQEGIEADLFEKIDYAKIPNSEKINAKAKYTIDRGYGPAYTMNRAAICYDPSKIDFEIKSWADLWKPELKGKVSIPELSTTFGPSVMYLASAKAGVDITTDNGTAAFAELKNLKPNLVKTYTKSSDLANMFANGEVVAAITADFAFGRIKGNVENAVFVDPTEGAYVNFNTVNIVKSSDNKELAYKFIDFLLSKEVQEKNAKSIGETPINTDVVLTADEVGSMTYGEIVDKANTVDHQFVNGAKANWVDTWNQTLNQ